ncbi:MAG: prenyltransferase/squalene oxidase repeat-containing protein, partial [Planctomycetota bacterium]
AACAPVGTLIRSHQQGLEFLIQAQQPDGSWGTFLSSRPYEIMLGTVSSHRAFRDAVTALCVLSLDSPAAREPAAAAAQERGLNFLLAAPATARATGEVFYDTWTHAYLLETFARLHRKERWAHRQKELAPIIEREIQLLSRRQGADGGWGYYDFGHSLATPSGSESTSFLTAVALLAFHEARRSGFSVNPDVIADGLSCLERLRLPGGSYVYGTYAQGRPGVLFNRVKGSLGRSQPCNLALWINERDITAEEMQEGLSHLRDHHHFIEIGKSRPYPHEAWYFTAGYYFMFGHYYAAKVIEELPRKAQRKHASWLVKTFARLQDPDGSWFDWPFYGYYKEYGTAYALLALQSLHFTLEGSELRP